MLSRRSIALVLLKRAGKVFLAIGVLCCCLLVNCSVVGWFMFGDRSSFDEGLS